MIGRNVWNKEVLNLTERVTKLEKMIEENNEAIKYLLQVVTKLEEDKEDE